MDKLIVAFSKDIYPRQHWFVRVIVFSGDSTKLPCVGLSQLQEEDD